MAVNNRLAAKTAKNSNAVEYEVGGMKVRLTPEIVRNYLVSGNKEAVSMQELAMFMNLCKYSQLNPWAKEAYCIKYGSEPAAMVVGKEAFQKRAEANPNYDGSEAGIVVLDESGEIVYRKGTIKLPGDEIVGGYAEVWRKDRTHSTRIEVSFDEYAGRKKDGSLNSQWSKKPSTMIRKVALVQALRETFPSAFGGMYTAEEQGTEEPEAYAMTLPVEEAAAVQAQVQAETEKAEQIEQKHEINAAGAVVDAKEALFGNN